MQQNLLPHSNRIRLDNAIKCFTTAVNVSTHLAEGHAALAAVTSRSLSHETYLTCVDTLGTWRQRELRRCNPLL